MRITRLGGPAPPGSASSLLRMKVSEALLLLAAGTAGGIFSTVVAIASLVTYPALLALGVPPLAANMTNTVSLVLTGAGSVASSRPELAGQGRRVLRLGIITALGGAAGAAVLLLTPASAGRGALRGGHVRRVLRRGRRGHAARGTKRRDPRAAGPRQCDQERVVRDGERPGRGLLRAVWRRAVEARAPARGGLPDRRVGRAQDRPPGSRRGVPRVRQP